MQASDEGAIRELLERERVWAAYALADLDPGESMPVEWGIAGAGLTMIYRGLEPPVLFACGDPEPVGKLLDSIPAGRYTFTLLGVHRSRLGARLQPDSQARMWRMVHRQSSPSASAAQGTAQLGPVDLPAIQQLFGDHADQPDSFHPSQLRTGSFFGLREAGELVSIAGTHVVSEAMSVAAIGNVFTRPDRRGQGLGRRTTAATLAWLLARGIQTIVLNVGMDNPAAIHLYRELGFMPFCGYYEGTAILHPDDS